MNLKEKIEKDFKKALKEKDKEAILTLRLFLAQLKNYQKEKRAKIAKENPKIAQDELEKKASLQDEDLLKVLLSEIKKRKEALEAFKKGKREDLVKKEKKELEILQRYLPKVLSKKEIKEIVQKVIAKIGAKNKKDHGKVMKILAQKLKGKADLKEVSKMVQEFLS